VGFAVHAQLLEQFDQQDDAELTELDDNED